MGKLKGRKADFQKIKLKPGRRLPKGLNVTDTSFKSKKIVIREQHLKDSSDGPAKKRGIKELLARLQHYNSGTRHECLLALKDLLVANPALIQNNIAALIERVCELMVDKDKAVRKKVLAVLTEMLQNVSSDFISPFFPVLTSYLCCAMTHIFTDIQQDSLNILDLLLDTFPHLTVTSNKILKNFLNQISSENEGAKGRVLLVKPGEKMTSQKWRLEVLHRIRKFLCMLVESWEEDGDINSSGLGSVIEWEGKGILNVGLLHRGLNPVLADKFTFYNWKQESSEIKDVEEVKQFCTVLVPLMLEIWLEASPDKRPHEIGSILSRESSEVLHCVLQVIWYLIEWLVKLSGKTTSKRSKNVDWFESKFYKNFETHFLNAFPYAPVEAPVLKKKGRSYSSQVSLSSHNLTICQIFVALKTGIDEKSSVYYEDVIEYLLSFLTSEVVEDESNLITAIGVVQNIIKNNVHHPLAVKLLERLETLYKHWSSDVEGRHLIENFFMEIVSSHNYNEFLSSPPVTSWMKNLPEDIVNSSDNPERMMRLLEIAGEIASCRFPAFIQSLLSLDVQIIGLLDDLPFSEKDLFTAQRHILNLICNLPSISGQTFRQLAQILRNPEIEVRNVDYLLQNLNFRFQTKTDPGFHPSHYLSLIICLQIGILQHEAPLIQQNFQSSNSWVRLQHFLPEISSFIVVPADYHVWERHQHISAKAVRYVWDFPENYEVRTAIFTYVTHMLDQFRYLPAHATAGILSLVAPFLREPELEDGGYLDSFAIHRFSLFDLALSALSTAAALSLLTNERPTNDLQVAEMIFEMVTDFIVDTECIEPVCKLMENNINSLKGLSEAQAECLGLIISKLLKFEDPEGESIASIGNMIQMIQAMMEVHMSRPKWLKKLVYNFKIKSEMAEMN